MRAFDWILLFILIIVFFMFVDCTSTPRKKMGEICHRDSAQGPVICPQLAHP